jgi:hypothetical protein
MAGKINNERRAEGESAQVPRNSPARRRKLLCNSLLHSPPVLLTSPITGSPVYQPNGLGSMNSVGGSTPEKREKAGEIEQNAAQEIELADRIVVPVLSILGEVRPDAETVMVTMMEMAQRTLFVTELRREGKKKPSMPRNDARPRLRQAIAMARTCFSQQKKPGRIPCGVKDALWRAERSPPSFRAPKTSLVQPGRPPAPPVLDSAPPFPFGLSPPFRRKTLFAFRGRGHHQRSRSHEAAGRLRFVAEDSWIDSLNCCRRETPCGLCGNHGSCANGRETADPLPCARLG